MTISALKTTITTTLDGDETLAAMNTGGVHDKMAPDNTSAPYIVYRIVDFKDDYTIKAKIRTLYQIEFDCIDSDLDGSTVASMADRLYALLTDSAFSVSGVNTMFIRRLGGSDNIEQNDSLVFQWITSTYQIELS